MQRAWLGRIGPAGLALCGPLALTGLLLVINPGGTRDYVFLYLAVVAILGVTLGLQGALLAAGASFLLVDYFFVSPMYTLSIAKGTDVLNLCVFFGAAGLVGTVGSRRRAAQLRAEKLAGDLRDANVELARLAETERMVRDLEETDRLRREVLANVSHELRTPLASILTGATTLQRKPELGDDLRTDVGALAEEARRLDKLVSELLDMTRIGGGVVDTRSDELDVTEVIEAAAQRLKVTHPGRVINIRVAPDTPEVLGDWHRLGQVLDNLMENADHAAPQGTAIDISAEPVNREVVVSVRDHGKGVPPALRVQIFERFVRGDDSDYPGIGLGLPIVRGLVEAQGGRVWIADSNEDGACFSFSLPAAETP